MHYPAYCSHPLGDCNDKNPMKDPAAWMRANLEPLWGTVADFIVFGHLHAAEITWPVVNGVVTKKSYADPQAPVYMLLGTAGAVRSVEGGWRACPFGRGRWNARHLLNKRFPLCCCPAILQGFQGPWHPVQPDWSAFREQEYGGYYHVTNCMSAQ